MDADDLCAYQPQHRDLLSPVVNFKQDGPGWSPDAQKRLARIPDFLRAMVKKRTEAYVIGLGENCVSADHMSELAAARFGSAGPPKMPMAENINDQLREIR